jgi:hypothetical protein
MPELPNRTASADVAVQMKARYPQSAEELERAAFAILGQLEGEVAEVALGAAVAINLMDSAVDIRFMVEAGSRAAVQQQIALVMEAIEHVLAPGDEVRTQTAPSESADLALSC